MQTVLDIDEALFRQLEQEARQKGKPLRVFLEEALREVVRNTPTQPGTPPLHVPADGLSNDDPFFTALDEIRTLGRLTVPHRDLSLD